MNWSAASTSCSIQGGPTAPGEGLAARQHCSSSRSWSRRSRRADDEMVTGTRRPSASRRSTAISMTGLPVLRVFRRAQSVSHMLERKTSEQNRPLASSREMPVIVSAARLNEVMRQSWSTVKTPSEMLSRMASVEAGATGLGLFCLFKRMVNHFRD